MIPSPLDWLGRLLERGPTRPLLVAGAITLALAPGLARLRFEADLLGLLPKRAAAARELQRYARSFGRNDPVTVLVTGGTPQDLVAFADRFVQTASRVRSVRSVEHRIDLGGAGRPETSTVGRVFPLLDAAGFARARSLLAPTAIDESVRRARAVLLQPGSRESAATIARDPLELRRLLVPATRRLSAGLTVDPSTGDFLSPDGEALVMLVRTRASAFDGRSARALLRGLEGAARRAKPGELTVQMTGAHAVAVATEKMIKSDLKRSSTLSLLLVLVVFAVAFGRLRALVAVGPPLLLGALWTAGFAGWFFGSLNAISVGFAAILLGLGDDLATHLFLGIDARHRAGSPRRTAAADGLRALGRPTVAAATTGALGFAALALSSFPAIRDLGLLAASGVLLTGLAVLLVTPAMTAFGRDRDGPRGRRRFDDWLGVWGGWLARRHRLVLALVGASVVGTVLVGPSPLARQVVSVRPRTLEPLRVQAELFRRFGGEPGQIVALVRARTLQSALEGSDAVADALGKMSARGLVAGWSSLSTLHPSHRTVLGRIAARDALHLPRAADVLEEKLRAYRFRVEPFAAALDDLRHPPSAPAAGALDPPAGSLLAERHLRRTKAGFEVATYVRPAAGVDPRRVARALRGAVPRARVTGYPLLEAEVRSLLPSDLLLIGLVSLTLVIAGLALHFRRFGPAVLAASSVAVGLLWMSLALRLLGIEWSAYNLLVVPVLVGISIDENVFLIHGVAEHEGRAVDAVARALAESGRAVITTASTTAAGFGALAICAFDGLRAIGATAALGVACCLLASLIVTPALLAQAGDAPRLSRH